MASNNSFGGGPDGIGDAGFKAEVIDGVEFAVDAEFEGDPFIFKGFMVGDVALDFGGDIGDDGFSLNLRFFVGGCSLFSFSSGNTRFLLLSPLLISDLGERVCESDLDGCSVGNCDGYEFGFGCAE